MRAWLLTSSPTSFLTLFLEGVLVWSLWLAARSRGDTNPSCLSQLDGFMKSVAHDAELLVPTRRFHEVSGARRRSVPKLRKLSVGLSANQDPMRGSRPIAFLGY